MALNRNTPEFAAFMAKIDSKMESVLAKLTSEMTDDKKLPTLRTQYATLNTLKKEMEELFNGTQS